MKKIDIAIQKRIIKHIYDSFDGNSIEVDEYIRRNAENIILNLQLQIEDYELIEQLGDSNNNEYYKFIKLFQRELKKYNNYNRIKINYEPPFYYITLTRFGKSVKVNLRNELLKKMLVFNNLKNKGFSYQKFCTLFLKDLNFKIESSRYTNDKGIDIICKYNIDYNEFIKCFNINEIYILAQVKCHNVTIGTNVIKEIIDNSLLLKFKKYNNIFIGSYPTVLIVFSYLGFNNSAIRYAKKNGVLLISNDFIIDLICSNNKDLYSYQCIKYLNKLK